MAGIALSLVKVSKAYGAAPILEDLSLGLLQGEKVGLIGRNGAGKSTLFRLLAGEEAPDGGEVILTAGLRIARLAQDPHFAPGATVREALSLALAEHAALIARHGEIHEALAAPGLDALQQERLHQELEVVEHHLHHMGWDLEPRLHTACTTWGLADLEAEVETLSGGWRKRVALAQAWLKDPDVLVLDEPTNHLDLEAVIAVNTALQNYPGTVLLVTHDEDLIDEVATRIWRVEHGRIEDFQGGYAELSARS